MSSHENSSPVHEHTDGITMADLEAIRDAHDHGRPVQPVGGAASEFQPLVEYFAQRAGTRPPDRIVFRCAGGCDAEVQRRGSYCDPCAVKDRLRQRRMMLADAYVSVSRVGSDASTGDSLEWCRAGHQQYLKATERARAAALRAADPTLASILIERAGWQRATGNVVLLGPKRIGKSKAAIACAHRVLDQALGGKLKADAFKFARGIRVVSGLKLGRARVTARLGDVPELERIAQRATLLILDEVGFEEDLAVIRDVIYDRCEDRGRPTFITSGLTRPEFETRYGAPTLERLNEQGAIIDLHPRSNTKAA